MAKYLGEDDNAKSGSHAGDHFNEFTFALEILTKHECRGFSHHSVANAEQNAVAEN